MGKLRLSGGTGGLRVTGKSFGPPAGPAGSFLVVHMLGSCRRTDNPRSQRWPNWPGCRSPPRPRRSTEGTGSPPSQLFRSRSSSCICLARAGGPTIHAHRGGPTGRGVAHHRVQGDQRKGPDLRHHSSSDLVPRRAYAWLVQADRQSTLTEVAQLAGVSLTTASKAINGRDRISDITRKRVLRAARELSYSPNLVARSLASGRSSTIGVLLRDPMIHRIAMPIVIGAESMLEQWQLSAIIADAREVVDRPADPAAMLRQRKADGLLIVGDNQGLTPSISASAKIPSVYVHGRTTNPRDVVHLVDDFAGAVAIVNHLVEVGRARMAHITGPEYSPAVQQRVLGIGHALEEHGRQLVGGVRYGQWSQRWASQAARDVLADAPDLDAIACGSDQIAARSE